MTFDRVRSLPFRAGVLLVAVLLVGCQTFRPVPAGELERGDRIRVRLNEESDVELRRVTARDVTRVNGETVDAAGSELVLSAFSVQRVDGAVLPAEGWTVSFPMDRIESIQKQYLARWRTAGLVTGLLVATIVGWETLGGGESGGQNGNGGQIE